MAAWYPSDLHARFAYLRKNFLDRRADDDREWVKNTLIHLSRISACEPEAGYRRPQDEHDMIAAMAALTYSARGHNTVITSYDVIDVYHRTHGEWPLKPKNSAELMFDILQHLADTHYPHRLAVEKISPKQLMALHNRYGLRGKMLGFFCDEPQVCFSDPADAVLLTLRLRSEKTGRES